MACKRIGYAIPIKMEERYKWKRNFSLKEKLKTERIKISFERQINNYTFNKQQYQKHILSLMLLRPYLEQLKKNKISSFETIETRVKIERERERERDLRHGSTIHSRFRTFR